MAGDPVHDGIGCGGAIALLLCAALFAFIVPVSIPGGRKDLEFCDSREGSAEITGTFVDLVGQSEGKVACNDGTVRWVRW